MAAAAAYFTPVRKGHGSPLRGVAAVLPTVGEGYGYGPESRLSQASAAARRFSVVWPRHRAEEQCVDRHSISLLKTGGESGVGVVKRIPFSSPEETLPQRRLKPPVFYQTISKGSLHFSLK